MKKIIILASLLFLASCWTNNETTVEVPVDPSPDVKTLYVQTCKNKDSSCKQLLCSKNSDLIFVCSDSITASKNCSEQKSFDNIVEKYKICSENKELLTNSIFNYSEKSNEFFEKMTPSELEKKIEEETAKLENWWESEWMWSFLAAAWWALLGWIIANKLFWWNSAQVPQRPNNIENNRTFNKNSLAETKKEATKETTARNTKREETKKQIANSKNQAKKSTPKKRKTKSKKRRR